MSSPVRAEIRGDVCVVRCAAAGGRDLAHDLDAELTRCRTAGARDVLIDLEPAISLGDETIAVLSEAARAFHADGGEFVVACEDRRLREVLARAGLAGGGPEGSAGPALEGVEQVALPDRPRWRHQFSFPAVDHELPNARRRIVAFAEICGMDGVELFELHVAVGEALANALTHGSPRGSDDDITVRFFCYPDEVAVEIGDQGEGMDAAPLCAPSPMQPGGRGIHFMRTLADDMLFACGPTGTRVLLVKKLH
jgi:anti-sigma regulatory factor (Ser/Thr protein kinase)/anti-anti-sigma regulatory factor